MVPPSILRRFQDEPHGGRADGAAARAATGVDAHARAPTCDDAHRRDVLYLCMGVRSPIPRRHIRRDLGSVLGPTLGGTRIFVRTRRRGAPTRLPRYRPSAGVELPRS
eukprot:scaffold87429_cov73-Phaeocystis_antarctica.AAC.3